VTLLLPLCRNVAEKMVSVLFYSAVVSLALSQAASAEENLLGLPDQAVKNAGKLMICGGGVISEDIYTEFAKLAQGDKARVVLIPTAKPAINRPDMDGKFAGLRRLVSSLDYLDTESRDEADQDDFVKPIDEATGVWIAGGSQGRLADIYRGTKVEQALVRLLERGGVIGGTSAGAAILSRVMIRYGKDPAVVGSGFNLLTKAVVDQHFLRRNRQERLMSVLQEHPEMIGLGVDESTALVVEGDHLRVIGQSQVVVCKYPQTQDQTPWVQMLRPGEEVDLVCRDPERSNSKQSVMLECCFRSPKADK
jgi:cyanophycinase